MRAWLPLLGLALGMGGCGLTHQMHSVAWTATLDQPPTAVCVQQALGALTDVFRTDLKDEPQGFVVGVYLKPRDASDEDVRARKARLAAQLQAEGIKNNRDWPDIFVRVGTRRREDFRMDYMGWPPTNDPREIAAREIVAALTATCDVPELQARIKENHLSEWLPYMFNI